MKKANPDTEGRGAIRRQGRRALAKGQDMAKVNDVLGAGMPIPGLAGQSGQSQKTQDGNNAFSDIMDRARDAGRQAGEDLMNMAKGSRSDGDVSGADVKNSSGAKKTNDVSEAAKKNAAKANKIKENAETSAQDKATAKTADASRAAADAADDAVAKAAEALGVSEEELVSVMEQLGLTAADLMQQGNLAQLLSQLQGIGQADILMSEELTDIVKDLSADLTADLSDVANELGMSLEELTDEIARQAALADGFETAEQGEAVFESLKGEEFRPEMVEEADDQDIQIISSDEVNAQTTAVKESTKAEHSSKDDSGEKNSKSDGEQPQALQAGAQAPVDQTALRNAESPVERFEQTLSSKQTREVIDQIAEHARVSGGDKMTSMEMMLNPANLGSIRLVLQSENGVVRGQLQASDDAVRAALESQLQQLRDALVEQGVKVEALEVTVAGHQLEQNLDQSGEQAEKEAERMAGIKNPRRILDLNEIGDEEEAAEEMTQAERLEVEMMRMGGNRMSYQV